ncbi:MAG: hypothetical protein R6U98_04660 [Pirellulaceae bacterium]
MTNLSVQRGIQLSVWSLIVLVPAGIAVGNRGIVRYTISNDSDTTLTSVTMEVGDHQLIYDATKLVRAQLVHFRSSGGVNVAMGGKWQEPSANDRLQLLDACLSSGTPNPGAAKTPLDAPPTMTGDNPTVGLAVRFDEPIRNRPGPDVVVFELQKGSGGDPFHVSPLSFTEGLHGITVDRYDLPVESLSSQRVAAVTLSACQTPPRNLNQFCSVALRLHSELERGFGAAVAGIDLSELGYAPGESAAGLFLQAVAGRPAFDPVAVLGLPAPSPENLLPEEPMPKPFQPARTALLQRALDGPLAGCEEIVFAQRVPGRDHWYGNFGHYCETESRYAEVALIKQDGNYYAFGEGTRLCRFNIRTGELRVLLNDPRGGIRDPNVHYDGKKILFSYRKGGTDAYHLYEIDVDGSGLKQLTDGPDNDIEPIYTPDGGIVFCSSRCHRYVPCWRTQVATLYRCDADGRNIRMLSNNAEQENTPWMLPDGRVLYMRWEYVDRNQLLYHHLWTVDPDGSNVMVYFGNQHKGLVMLDAKPIPNTNKVVASFSPGHGRPEHMGHITIVGPAAGPDDMDMARRVSDRQFRDPYPLGPLARPSSGEGDDSDQLFLAADDEGIHFLTGEGETQLIYRPARTGARWTCHEPRPLRSRPREHVLPTHYEDRRSTGRLVLSDVYEGRNMRGVERGDIKKLLVLEQLPKPANFSGGPEPLTIGGSFTLQRVLGTVPVEPDGSAHFEVPAVRSVFFVALDDNDLAVKRMQSFVSVQPGETMSCVGCHEQRTRAPHDRPGSALLATTREPSQIKPFSNVPQVLDFPRDIQPILDRHCVECHNPDRREGGVDLCGDRTPLYTTSYWTMFVHGLVQDGRNKYGNRPPRTIGSSASRLTELIDGSHYDAQLTQREKTIVRLWIESGATYPGTYAALGSGMETVEFPKKVMRRRCATCHTATQATYRNPKEGAFYYQFGKRKPPQPLLTDINDIILIRHLAYFQLGESRLYQAFCNLDRPAKSLFLKAPLSEQAGGLELCGEPVFQNAADGDYRAILATIQAARQRLIEHGRFDMPGFRPNRFYIREMQNFGILPRDLPANAPVDVYAIDRKYWQDFVHGPGKSSP